MQLMTFGRGRMQAKTDVQRRSVWPSCPMCELDTLAMLLRSLPILWMLLLVGCGAVPKSMLKDYGRAPLTAHQPETEEISSLLKRGENGLPQVAERCWAAPLDPGDIRSCTAARNSAVSALRSRADRMCIEHRSTIYGNEAVANIALGTVVNLASGAAAVVPHELTKSAFAALALFANSERSLINETVYKQMLVSAINDKIVQAQTANGTALDANLKADAGSYGLFQAIEDVERYHNACSFMNGLQLALKEGSQSSEQLHEVRLRGRLDELRLQMTTIPVGERTTSQKPIYEAMTARYVSMSAELQKLEAR